MDTKKSKIPNKIHGCCRSGLRLHTKGNFDRVLKIENRRKETFIILKSYSFFPKRLIVYPTLYPIHKSPVYHAQWYHRS